MARKAEKKTVATIEMNASCDKKNAVFFTCSEHSKESCKYSVGQREDGFPEPGSYHVCKFCRFSEVDGDCEVGYRRRCNVIGKKFDVVNEKVEVEGSCKGEAVMIEGVEYCGEYRLFEIKA